MLGILGIVLSGCSPGEPEEQDASSSETIRSTSTEKSTTAASSSAATEESTTESLESTMESTASSENTLKLTNESLNQLLFPNGENSFWATKEETLKLTFSRQPKLLNVGIYHSQNDYAVVTLPPELMIDPSGNSFTVAIDDTTTQGNYKAPVDQQLTV